MRPGPTFGAALLAGVISGAAAAMADTEMRAEGRAIAAQWCGECHALPDAAVARDAAPPLSRIVRDREVTAGGLRAWLSTPHPQMPDLDLTRREIDALVVYLQRIGE